MFRDTARGILLGREEEVRSAAERLRLDLGGVPIVDPGRSVRFEAYKVLVSAALSMGRPGSDALQKGGDLPPVGLTAN